MSSSSDISDDDSQYNFIPGEYNFESDKWDKCDGEDSGHCSTEYIVNSNECYCCKEIQECCCAIEDENVLRE